MTDAEINSVGYLQEYCQKHLLAPPKYDYLDSVGPDHCKTFTVKCSFQEYVTQGNSRTKKQAKTESAKAMIDHLKQRGFLKDLNIENSLRPSNNTKHSAEGEEVQLENCTGLKSKHPISALNEFCQKKSIFGLPAFIETSAAGTFICECKLGLKKTHGHSATKKGAKTEAALKMCVELGLLCNDRDYLKSEEVDYISEKNPVSAVQELSAENNIRLEFTELPKIDNLFAVKCTYGSVSCVGKGHTKKLAKIQAATEVLKELSVQGVKVNRQVKSDQKYIPVVPTHSRGNGAGRRGLEDFPLDSSEEEEDNINDKEKSSQEIDVSSPAASISLDPSVNGQLKSNQENHILVAPTLSKGNGVVANRRLEDFEFDAEEEDNADEKEKPSQEIDIDVLIKGVSDCSVNTKEADAALSVETS